MSTNLTRALHYLQAFEKEVQRVEPTPAEMDALTEIETIAFQCWRGANDVRGGQEKEAA